MKLKSLIVFLFVTVFVGFFYFYNKNKEVEEMYLGYETVDYNLEDRQLKLLLADTPAKREKGLMFYRQLEGVDGMMFTYPEKLQAYFWNRNTFMDLDVYWLSGDQVVGKSFLPSIEKSGREVTISSPKEIDKVIEIPTDKR